MTETALPFGPEYGFGIYMHWPYCAKICPYCDFNVYAAKQRDTDSLFEAVLQDLAAQAESLEGHPALTSIYLGGGTPSLMNSMQIGKFIDACYTQFGLSPDCEITLEANPNNVSEESAHAWRQAGINRLSIGLQSLDNPALKFLGRDHDSSDAERAVAIAGKTFETFSIDMIYARPGQSLAEWEAELKAALALGAPHLSLYELTIAPGTAFDLATKRGKLSPLPDDAQAEMYELTEQMTQAAGLLAYEISNHAASARDQSRHNMIYWRSGDWLGIGPGAHGRLTRNGKRTVTEALKKPDAYIAATVKGDAPLETNEVLSDEDAAHEIVAMGLRPVAGIERARIEALLGREVPLNTFEHLKSGGWLIEQNGFLRLTPSGRLLADRITLELLA